MKPTRKILVSGAPFIHDSRTSARDAWLVVATLLPVLGWRVLLSGPPVLAAAGLSVLAALVSDALQSGLRRKFELDDGSACVSGLVVSLLLPIGVPLYIPVAASAFAILVVKGAFGGLGNNWMNPALGGVAFAWLDWPALLSAGEKLAASGHALVAAGLASSIGVIDDRFGALANAWFFQPLGANLPPGYFAGLLGLGPVPGPAMAIVLAASTILIGQRVIRWQVPAAMFGSYALGAWIFGDVANGLWFAGDPLGRTLGGSFLLVAFFVATDPVTSPSRPWRMLVFGVGAGILSLLFSELGEKSLGPVIGVLVMNVLMPLLEEILERIPKGARLRNV